MAATDQDVLRLRWNRWEQRTAWRNSFYVHVGVIPEQGGHPLADVAPHLQ